MKTIKAQGGNIIPVSATGNRQQQLFREKSQLYANNGGIVTPGYLRLEFTAPNSGVSTINFQTLDTSGVKTATERRLKLSDTFTVTDIAFYLGLAAATAYVSSPTDYAKQTLHTFPNPTLFSTKADELEVLYNGYLSLRVDTTTFLDSVPLRQFYRVGTSQQQTAAANVPQIHRDEWALSMYGRTSLIPSIELNGQSNIEWSITLPDSTNLAAAANTNNVNLVLFLTGFLNQGAASLQQRVQRRLK